MNPGFQQPAAWGQPQGQPQQATPWGAPAGGGFQQPMQQAPQVMPPPPGVAPISFDPAMFTQGGMIDNVVVRFTNCRAIIYNYGGKSQAAPVFSTDLQILNQQTGQPQEGTQPQQQVWSMGKVEDFTVNAEGTHFIPLTGKRGPNEKSKFALLVKSLVASAFPVELLRSGNVTAMNNLVAFVQREAVKYEGLKAQAGQQGTGGGDDQTVLVVREIKQLPGGMQVQQPMQQPMPQQPVMQQMPSQQPMQPQFQQQPQFAQPQQPQMQPMQPMPAQFAQAQAPMTQAPMAQPPAPAGAPQITQDDANVLRAVMATNPATMGNFTIALFQATIGAEERRRMLQLPQVQAAILGSPVALPQ